LFDLGFGKKIKSEKYGNLKKFMYRGWNFDFNSYIYYRSFSSSPSLSDVGYHSTLTKLLMSFGSFSE
jgi:hypothetical protein